MSVVPQTPVIVEALRSAVLAAWDLSPVDYGKPLTGRDAPNAAIYRRSVEQDPQEGAWVYTFEVAGRWPLPEGENWEAEREDRAAEIVTAIQTGPDLAGVAYLPYVTSLVFPDPNEARDTYEMFATVACRTDADHH